MRQTRGAALQQNAGNTCHVGIARQRSLPLATVAHRAHIRLEGALVIAHRNLDVVAIVSDKLLQINQDIAHYAAIRQRHLQRRVRTRA